MKLGILVVILCLLTPLAQARSGDACEELFSREKAVREREYTPLTTDLEPISSKVTAPNSRLYATQPEKFDDLMTLIVDRAFAKFEKAFNDGRLDRLFRNTQTEVRETIEIAQSIAARFTSMRTRRHLAKLIPKLGLTEKFKRETAQELSACRAQASVCQLRLEHRSREIESLKFELLELDAIYLRQLNRMRSLLVTYTPRFEGTREWPEAHAKYMRFIGELEGQRSLIEVTIGNLRVQTTGAQESSSQLNSAIERTLDALVLAGITDIAKLESRSPVSNFSDPLITLKQLEVLAEIENRARKPKYQLSKRDIQSLSQIESPRATTQLLLLLGKYSEPRERALAIEVLGGRTYRPESLAALGVALTKVSKVEAEKIYEIFLFKNHSSEATSAIIDLAFVYKHGRNPSARISREKILLRHLSDEHVELLSRTFDAFTTVLWTENYREARIILIQALAKTNSPAARQVLVEIARGEWGEAQVAANLPYDTAAAKAERRSALDETMAAAAAVLEHMPAVTDTRDKPK